MLNRVSANSKTIANLHDRKVIKGKARMLSNTSKQLMHHLQSHFHSDNSRKKCSLHVLLCTSKNTK